MHEYILGVYHLYDVLTTKYPDILFESCASGGARQHLLGRAADIQVSGASPLLVGQIAEYYLGGHGGIGVYQTF